MQNHYRGQGAIELNDASFNCRHLAGQGATEYLVLLAVVLIVALVSVALLGFFPGMASDAQMMQSIAYWSSASPIAIEEMDAYWGVVWGFNILTISIKNSGAYPVRITKVLGGNGKNASMFICHGVSTGFCSPTNAGFNISDYYILAPGEKKMFDMNRFGFFWTFAESDAGFGSQYLNFKAGSSICENSASSPGTLIINNFGFEYIEYIDGQQITKRQIGAKPLVIKRREPA